MASIFPNPRKPVRPGRKAGGLALILIGGVAVSAMMASTASAQSLQDLKAQIDALQRKVADLEQQQKKNTKKVAKAVTGGDAKGSFMLPGTSTSVRIGGYVKGDAIYTDGNGQAIGDSFFAGAIPVDGEAAKNRSGHTRLHARQSRLYVKTWTPTPFGTLKTHIEGDFFGTGGNENVSNSTSLRLRHAYGKLGNFLAGQTWSTFMDLASLPPTVDFEGPAGQIFVRQAQLRYTMPFEGGSFAVAIENPEGDISGDGGNNIDRLPDFIARARISRSWGGVHLAGLVRQLRFDDGTNEDSETGWGVNLAANVKTVGKDKAFGQITYGDGIGRYIEGGSGLGGVLVSNNIDAIKIVGGFAGYTHYWADNLQSTVVYGRTQFDNPSSLGTGATEYIQTVHANLMWQPVKAVNLGLEFIWGQRQEESGADGDAKRVQFGAKYSF